jgi:methylmalonyl-CoA/ethylmalonyl-CoA epimerase
VRSIRFDHIAIAVPRLVDAQTVLEGELGGASTFGAVTDAFRFWHWRFEGGGRIEVLEPAGADGFLHRFLAQRGRGIHHVTFTVPDLREVCDRARALGYSIVGYNDSDPEWKEAFLHPREALGIVVQFAEPHPDASSGASIQRWQPPPGPANPPPPVTMLGLRMRARSAERAQAQWGAIIQGVRDGAADGSLVYRWPGSFMSITVEIDQVGAEGPIGIEYTGDRPVALPDGPHPVLGAVFQRR